MKIITFETMYNGLHWEYEHNGNILSIICHSGSIGWKLGLFEIQPSWVIFKGNSVKGYLTFREVSIWIKRLEKTEKAMK